MGRRSGQVALGAALLGFAALRVASVHTTAFNWDEFALFHDVARSAAEGRLFSAGHAGLPQALLIPLFEDCVDEITSGRAARLVWQALGWTYLAGVFALLWQLLPEGRRRLHDAAFGTALLGLAPVFLEWSIQVRTDQPALAAGAWGAAGLIASRRHLGFAVPAGLAFGIGWLATQKLAYVALLAGLLAVGDLFIRAEWQTRREGLRAAGVAGGAIAVIAAWGVIVSALFDVGPRHPAVHVAAPAAVTDYLDIFDFYRKTIGYSQYVAALPNLALHVFLVVVTAAATAASAAARTRRLALAWAVLALGVAVGIFHAAAFAYFLMTLGLFAAVGLALALPSLRTALDARWPDATRLAVPVVWAALILPATLQVVDSLRDTQAVQRESLRFVHRNFAPDRAGFQPETALFCGTEQPLGLWFSQRIYRTFEEHDTEAEIEQLLARFRREPVHYLVQSFRLNQFPTPVRQFWDEHYQPYRDAVFVAGRRLRGEPGETIDFELIVDGPYRWFPLGGAYPVRVNGEDVAPGDVVSLRADRHTAEFSGRNGYGVLVLALADTPGVAPLPFYKSY